MVGNNRDSSRVNRNRKEKKPTKIFPRYMKSKLIVFFGILMACLLALIGRITYIEYTNGDEYKKEVLSRQNYDSITIPYQRGDILDTNGTVLATSVAVYNVILDCTVMTAKEEYVEPTISALMQFFPDFSEEQIRSYANEETKRPYIILAKKLPYDVIQPFVEFQEMVDEKGNKVNPYVKGIWFETEYVRQYPYGDLAADVIGFTSSGDVGVIGLENYYNDVLNGVNGREYGYLNSDSAYEKTFISAQDGNSIVISIDENIQSIVQEKIEEWNAAYTDNYHEGPGAENIAVVIQDPNTGEIKAMASYPEFDLNNPRDLSFLYSEEALSAMTDEESMDAMNALWQNYCVTSTYEPGSVQKPMTVACGIETGLVTEDMTFLCDGFETYGPNTIKCVNVYGHGYETVAGALMDSCNDSLMQMSYLIGAERFLDYQSIFGFGQKTGIDLPGEAYTASLMYTIDNIKPVDLATNSFGQNYNCTMIQMITAFSSLINGGNYYQPYLVKKVIDANGNTVSVTDPTVLKHTVSESTSDLLRDYLYQVVSDGTGAVAKVDGYSMGGKTGTAEKLPRADKNYLVSFMGFAPYENPELVIYCIIDTPNVQDQPHSNYAQNLVREILKEVFPYMNIYPDEELTGKNADLTITGAPVIEEEPAEGEGEESPEAPEEGGEDEPDAPADPVDPAEPVEPTDPDEPPPI